MPRKPMIASTHETQTTGGGGLPSGVIGGVTAASWGIFQYNNRPDLGWQIGLIVTITPDPDADQTQEALQWVEAGPFEAQWKVARLGPVMPCNDVESMMPIGDFEDQEEAFAFYDRVFKGEEAITDPETYRGRYMLSFSPLPRDSSYVEFRDKAKEAGISPDVFGEDAEAFIGPLYGRWDRLPKKERNFSRDRQKDPNKKETAGDILLLTEVMPNPWTGKKAGKKGGATAGKGTSAAGSASASSGAKTKAKASSAAAKSKAAEEDDEEDEGEEIDEFDMRLITDASKTLAGRSLPVGRLAVKVSKMGYKGGEVSDVLTRLQDASFYDLELAQAVMTFDPKTKTVSAVEEEE